LKHAEADSFWADWARLNPQERELFKEPVRGLNGAFARRGSRRLPDWPARYRIRPMTGRPGVWGMTWSFAGPDGRATFEIVELDGEPGIRWRRVGHHGIYDQP
jgi:hypothetical protein